MQLTVLVVLVIVVVANQQASIVRAPTALAVVSFL